MVPQKRPVDQESAPSQTSAPNATSQVTQEDHAVEGAPQPASTGPDLLYSDFSSSGGARTVPRESVISNIDRRCTTTASVGPKATQDKTHIPVAKRRRLEDSQPTAGADRSSTSSTNANTPLPTIEGNEIERGDSRGPEPGSATLQSAKAKKPRSSAQAKRAQRVDDEAAAVDKDGTGHTPAKTKRPTRKSKGKEVQRNRGEGPIDAAGALPASDAQTEQGSARAKPKRKKKTTQTIEEAAAAVVEEAVQGSTKSGKRRGRKPKYRAVTPEGGDAMVITPSEVTMSELCTDRGTGRRSQLDKHIVELERAEFVRKKQKQLQKLVGQAEPENQSNPPETADESPERLARQNQREEDVAQNVPNTVIVNGQIQIDEDSLQIDRHAVAAAARADEEPEIVIESALTKKINSASYLKRDKSGGWDEILTERFYEALRMFGTDFQMIRQMFPGRTRHKIKLKFVKEERSNPHRIKAALLGERLPVDLPELEKMAGIEFSDPKELERDMLEDRKKLEEETLAEKEEMDNAKKVREEQIAVERAAAEEESSAKENHRGKKRKKGERQKGKKGASRKKDKHSNRGASRSGAAVSGNVDDNPGL